MSSPPSLWSFEALLFDLDGVITRTAALHAAAWKHTFDELLAERAGGEPYVPFDAGDDYARYLDGRRRYEGVASFLASRGIELAWGTPEDPPDEMTVCAVGNRKNEAVEQELASRGVELYEDTVQVIRAAHERQLPLGVVSASDNAVPLLAAAGLLELFRAWVTGVEAAELELPGKPAPDTFLRAASELGVSPARAAVFEDALSGVRAARAGGFGLVIGVDRGRGTALREAGADLVCGDLRRLL